MNQLDINTEKKHNYFYKTINILNCKYYYGIRSTDKEPVSDVYLGSGNVIKKAIKKHGRNNFTKEIIADYPTRKEASDHEARVVTLELIQLEECYNCRTGGDNQFTHIPTEEHKKKISEANKGKHRSEDFKKKMSGKNHHNFGKTASEDTKKKLSKSHIGKTLSEQTKQKLSERMKGCKHPQFGKTGELSPNFGKKASEELRNKLSNGRKDKNNPMFGKTHTEEARRRIGEAKRGEKNCNFGKPLPEVTKEKLRNQPYCKPCRILGAVYISVKEAARQLKMPENTVRNRLNSKNIKFKDWQYQ